MRNIKSSNSKSVSLKTYSHDVAGNAFVKRENSSVSQSYYKDNFLNFNLFSSYALDLKDNHFNFMLGYQYEDMMNQTSYLKRDGIIIDTLPVIDLTSGTDYNGQAVVPSVSGNNAEWNTAGFFGRLNYNYKMRYLMEVNLRYDGTSRFRGDKRWNWFPSFSLGWNIAQEKFWEPLADVVGTLKLRASYGLLGNQNTDSWYPTYQIISTGINTGNWLQNGKKTNIAYKPQLISSTLSWEKVKTWNIGVDLGMFSNKLTGSFDYYIRKTLDMVGPAMELPLILGTSVPKSNNTDLKTSGFELSLTWQDRLANGLTYSAKFMLSDNKTEVTKYPNATKTLSTYYNGQELGTIWGYKTIGIAKTKEEMENHLATLPNGGQNALGSQWTAGDVMYEDVNGDGKINNGSNTLDDHGDLVKIGNNLPRYLLGLDLNAAWKGFDIRAFFQGVCKRDYWTSSDYFWGVTSSGEWSAVGLKNHLDYFRSEDSRDLKANLNSYYPRPLFVGAGKNQQVQTRYLQNAAYIRLKNITIGYTLPQSLTQKFAVTRLRLFFMGENLWTGTNLANMFDPETISGGSNGNGNSYPLQKTLSVGLNITL